MDKPVIKKSGRKTSISFFTLDNRVESVVKEELDRVFNNNNTLQTGEISGGMVYTCVKELLVNASKANIKKTFFIEAKINEKNKETYNLAKKNVNKLLNENYMTYLREKLKKYSHNVELTIETGKNGIVLMVKNPTPLLEDEELKIRETFRKAMKGDSADFAVLYSEDNSDREGAGLGLYLVIQLLKEMGIDPSYFRIGVVKNDTVARIELPLDPDYISLRSK